MLLLHCCRLPLQPNLDRPSSTPSTAPSILPSPRPPSSTAVHSGSCCHALPRGPACVQRTCKIVEKELQDCGGRQFLNCWGSLWVLFCEGPRRPARKRLPYNLPCAINCIQSSIIKNHPMPHMHPLHILRLPLPPCFLRGAAEAAVGWAAAVLGTVAAG